MAIMRKGLHSSVARSSSWLKAADLATPILNSDEHGGGIRMDCPGCAADIPPDHKFCWRCGVELTGSNSVSGTCPTFRSGGASSQIHGEVKHVTVLFADIEDSTTIIRDLTPEAAARTFQPVRTLMEAAVRRYGGYVRLWAGDGLMAVFGAPNAEEDHALAACYTALEIHKAIGRLGGNDIRVRIGINSGPALVQYLADRPHADFELTGGLTLHLASRMEGLARAGSTFVTGRTVDLVRGFVETQARGARDVRGLSDPVDVYELTGVSSAHTHWEVRSMRTLTPLAGRRKEFDVLQGFLRTAKSSRLCAVEIEGEAGTGKSRLVHEFLRGPSLSDCRVLVTGAGPYDATVPFLQLKRLVRECVGGGERDDIELLLKRLIGLKSSLGRVTSAVQSLLDLPVSEVAWQQMQPVQRRNQIVEGLCELFVALAREQTLVIVFENLHCCDAASRGFIETLVEYASSVGLLLIFTTRPGQMRINRGAAIDIIKLGSLDSNDARAMLDSILGSDASLNPLKQTLLNHSGGVPLFIEEIVRSLRDTGILHGPPGCNTVSEPDVNLQVPDSVQTALEARIDHLEGRVKSVLQAAAVIGTQVPRALLETVSGMDSSASGNALALLESHDLVTESGDAKDAEYHFRHALIRDTAYAMLLDEERTRLHRKVVLSMELVYRVQPLRDDEVVDTSTFLQEMSDRRWQSLALHADALANHAVLAQDWQRAVGYLSFAGAKAVSRSSHDEALAYFERALEANRNLTGRPGAVEREVDLRIALREPLFQHGNIARVFHHLDEAQRAGKSLDDGARLANLMNCKSHIAWLAGRQQESARAARRAISIAESAGLDDLKTRGRFHLALSHYGLAEYEPMRRELETVIRNLSDRPEFGAYGVDARLAVLSRAYLVRGLVDTGDFAHAIQICGETKELARRLDCLFTSIILNVSGGYLCIRTAEYDDAIGMLREARRLCDEGQTRLMVPVTSSFLGAALLAANNAGEALVYLREAVERGAEIGLMFQHPLRVAFLAECYFQTGEQERASTLLFDAVQQSSRQKEWMSKSYACFALSRMSPPFMQPAKAEQWRREAVRLADAFGLSHAQDNFEHPQNDALGVASTPQ